MKFSDKIFSNSTKKLAILIDPDNTNSTSLLLLIKEANKFNVDYFFVGGSLVNNNIDDIVFTLKLNTEIPVILFPGNPNQFTDKADAILFLSLISGRNPEYLISNQVISALRIKKSGIAVIPTGYILIENGLTTAVEYISNTKPIPSNKPEITVATAVAGELLGMKTIYLEAGSGATIPVSDKTIKMVKSNISSTLIVGGGIKTKSQLKSIFTSGANIAVIGTSIENKPELLQSFIETRNEINL